MAVFSSGSLALALLTLCGNGNIKEVWFGDGNKEFKGKPPLFEFTCAGFCERKSYCQQKHE